MLGGVGLAQECNHHAAQVYYGLAARSHRNRCHSVHQRGARVERRDEAIAATDPLEVARLVGSLLRRELSEGCDTIGDRVHVRRVIIVLLSDAIACAACAEVREY